LAVKDLIDVLDTPTTGGSRAIAERAVPAVADAACLAGARAGGARIVGKTNLHELAFGTTGINESFGTPENPFDPSLVPGGSSSGSAVAVASGEAELAFGSDTGGSIRIPSAFCGTTGLKTTFGRIPVSGTIALAPSMDTIGPMARNVDGVVRAMALLEPGFSPAPSSARELGRLRLPGIEVDAEIDEAIDEALALSGFSVTEIVLEEWSEAYASALNLLLAEAVDTNRSILADPERRALLGAGVAARFTVAETIDDAAVIDARLAQVGWSARIAELFTEVELLTLPSVHCPPPTIENAGARTLNTLTLPLNFAGVPAISLPVRGGWMPASLQLVGPLGSEELIVATAAIVERAAGWTWSD
jgi:amidase